MKKIYIDPDNIDQSLIKEAVDTLSKGGIVAMPTETVYGLGALADNLIAVEKLYAIKKRSKDKPFSLAIDSVGRAVRNYFDIFPPFGYRLIEKFWPGPLTIIYYTQDGKKIGIRVPAHAVALEILKELRNAICIPSANLSGDIEAVNASRVENTFNGIIDLIVDSGECAYSQSSTVVDLTQKPFKVLRAGVISEEDIAKIFIKKRILFVCTGNSCRSPMAQFMLEKYLRPERLYFEDRYEIISRGVSAFENSMAAHNIVDILKEKEDLDILGFSSKRLDRYMVLSSDLIFTMEDAQSKYILKFEPSVEGRLFNLKKFLPFSLEKDIPDPIGKSRAVYEEVYSLIKEAVLELKDWV